MKLGRLEWIGQRRGWWVSDRWWWFWLMLANLSVSLISLFFFFLFSFLNGVSSLVRLGPRLIFSWRGPNALNLILIPNLPTKKISLYLWDIWLLSFLYIYPHGFVWLPWELRTKKRGSHELLIVKSYLKLRSFSCYTFITEVCFHNILYSSSFVC